MHPTDATLFEAPFRWQYPHHWARVRPSGLFLAELSPIRQLQQSRSWVKMFKIFKIEFESTKQKLRQNRLNGGWWSWFRGASSHEKSDSDKSLEKILKTPQHEFFKGIFPSVPTDGSQMKTYEAEVRAVVEQQYLPKVPVPIQHMASRQRCFEIADLRLSAGKFSTKSEENG